MPGYFTYAYTSTQSLELWWKCDGCGHMFSNKWSVTARTLAERGGARRSAICLANRMASDKQREVTAAMGAGSFVTCCPQCGFVPLYVADAHRRHVVKQSEMGCAMTCGGIGLLGALILTAATGAPTPVVVVSAIPVCLLAAAAGRWLCANQKRAAEEHPDYPNHEWATADRAVPRDKINVPIWGNCGRPDEWPTATRRASGRVEERVEHTAVDPARAGADSAHKLAIPSIERTGEATIEPVASIDTGPEDSVTAEPLSNPDNQPEGSAIVEPVPNPDSQPEGPAGGPSSAGGDATKKLAIPGLKRKRGSTKEPAIPITKGKKGSPKKPAIPKVKGGNGSFSEQLPSGGLENAFRPGSG